MPDGPGSGFTIIPDDLHGAGRNLGDFGDKLHDHGRRMTDVSGRVASNSRRDRSGIGGVIAKAMDTGGEVLGSVFTQAGRVSAEAGKRLHLTADDHVANETNLTGKFRGIHDPGKAPDGFGHHTGHDEDPDPGTPTGSAHGSGSGGTGSKQPDAKWNGPPMSSVTDPTTKKTHYIRPGDVHAAPLTSHSNELDGMTFHSKADDITKVTDWAKRKNRESDTTFRPGEGPTPGSGVNTKKRKTAPWHDTPFYVHAHANKKKFSAMVDMPGGTPQKMHLDGKAHGQAVEANQYFQHASGKDPNRPLTYMSCNSAYPGGSAASGSANYLHGAGHQQSVYAPTGTGVRFTSKDGNTSYYGVKSSTEQGNYVPGEFQEFPGKQPGSSSGTGSTP